MVLKVSDCNDAFGDHINNVQVNYRYACVQPLTSG